MLVNDIGSPRDAITSNAWRWLKWFAARHFFSRFITASTGFFLFFGLCMSQRDIPSILFVCKPFADPWFFGTKGREFSWLVLSQTDRTGHFAGSFASFSFCLEHSGMLADSIAHGPFFSLGA